MSAARRRLASIVRPRLAALAVPLVGSAVVGAAVLGLPTTGRLVADSTSWGSDWATPMPPVQPPTFDAVPLPAGLGTTGGWSSSTWGTPSRIAPVLPVVVPPAPPPPALPALPRTAGAGEATYAPSPPPPPVQRLGPVQHFTATVAPGASVTLPVGTGFPHILCGGRGAPASYYWLDSTTSTGTAVHRYDGAGSFDFYYRDVTTDYRQTKPCS